MSTRRTRSELLWIPLLVAVPLLALVAAVPVAWGWGVTGTDLVLAVVFYLVAAVGSGVGYHRHFTHGAFRATRPLRLALAVAGGLAVQGPLVVWVADHRCHHQHADEAADLHSPWRYGECLPALLKGMVYAHLGWILETRHAPVARYAPDLVRDRTLMRVSRHHGTLTAVSLLAPPVLGACLTWSWPGAVTAFFWAGLVRIGLVHHVTWSVNSVCHVYGARPFRTADRSANVWWLAPLSLGESWHNAHHADPTSARFGALRGQPDPGGRLIRWFERAGWAYDVRWPGPDRVLRKLVSDRDAGRVRAGRP